MKNVIKLLLSMILSVGCSQPLYGAAYPDKPIEVSLDGGVTVLDYSAMIIPQVGVDCGLHALKNSIALFNYLTNIIDVPERNRQLQNESIGNIPTMVECRACIECGGGTLDPEAIYRLIDMLKDQYPFNVAYKNDKLLVLDSLNHPDLPRPSNQNKQLATILNEMRSGDPFVHAFVLGNMDEVGVHEGHWVAGVLVRSEPGGPLVLHMADSAANGSTEINAAMGRKLMNFLAHLNLENLKFGAIRRLLDEMQKNIHYEEYEPAIIKARDIIEEARLQKIFSDSRFDVDAERLNIALLVIPDELITARAKQLKEDVLAMLAGREEGAQQFNVQSRSVEEERRKDEEQAARMMSAARARDEVRRGNELFRQQQEAAAQRAGEERRRDEAQAARMMEAMRAREEMRRQNSLSRQQQEAAA